ncbi:MAG: hypothetical protein EP318_18140 [Rhodobacteraceae bacterium]|nr:MAG: hypothetical protein EP318_18140 [Paracoccaceae bacterium]
MNGVRMLARLGLVAALKSKAENTAHRLAIAAAVGGFAVLLLLVALSFLAFAGFLALEPGVGPVWAALITALVVLVLAVVVLWIGIPETRPGFLKGRRRPRPVAPAGSSGSAIAMATAFATGFLTGHARGKDRTGR